ncbi:MRN complex-interacting protein isoform X1 [Hemitrygon akajei]|uniref:MRN complex-interacting protein isoform X1 n=1 Tax=Hemitrygon akajei TaxID=2704970 RepID=UPI003BF9BF33
MAQRFQALRCCSCQTYQVQQVKKSKKWNCKLCGEKQSVLKVYGQGSGSDCRKHVQKLNLLRGMKMQAMEATTWPTEEPGYSGNDCRPEKYCVVNEPNQATSRWCVYLDQKHVEEPVEQEGGDDKIVYTDRQQFQTDMKNAISKRSKRKRGSHLDSEKLDTRGHCTHSNWKETAKKKMQLISKINRGKNWNPELGEGSDILNKSKLEYSSPVQQGEKSRSDEAFLPKQPSKWDRFLPHSHTTGSEHPVCPTQHMWLQDSSSTRFPLECSVLEDQDDDVDRSVLSTSLVLSSNTWPHGSLGTETAMEKVMTRPLNAASMELFEEASGLVDSPELSDSAGVSNNACGVGKDSQPQESFLEFLHCTTEDSCNLKPVTSLSLPALTPHPPSVRRSPGVAPGLTTKQPYSFTSLFQTGEDFDDL